MFGKTCSSNFLVIILCAGLTTMITNQLVYARILNISLKYILQTALPPEQIAWCGLDSVLLYWDEMLLMVGPNGDPVQYMYDEPILLIPECDGVRILSNSTMEFLQRVPDSTVSIFQIGSTEPGALLYDALDHFDKHSAKVLPCWFSCHSNVTFSLSFLWKSH